MTIQIPQTNYTNFPAAALAGQLADLMWGKHVDSMAADVDLDCGLFLVLGASYGRCKIPTATGQVTNNLQGVALYEAVKEPYLTTARFKARDMIPVLRRGRVWVPVVSVTVTDDVIPYIIHTGSDAGKIRGDNTNATAAPSGVKVLRGAAAGGLALVEVNLV
jgi:hypothetical protein